MSMDVRTAFGLTRSLVIYYGQPWKRVALRRFYRDLVKEGDLVFDIGAHVGSRTRTLLALGADVLAVEPQPAFADFLERKFAGQLAGLVRKAVGRQAGAIELHISSAHPTVTSISTDWIDRVGSTRGFRGVNWDKTITVEMVTLDMLIAQYGMPRFCKIDVEGAEADILAGLSQPIEIIAFEYIPSVRSVAMEVVERLEYLGNYRFNHVEGELHRFSAEGWVTASAMLDHLRRLDPEGPSGDIYARIEPL